MSLTVLQSVHSVRPYLEGLFLPQGQFAVITAAETWSLPWHSSGRCTLQDLFGPAFYSPSGAQFKREIKLLISFSLCFICCRDNRLLTNQRKLRCISEVCKAPVLPLIPNIADARSTKAGVSFAALYVVHNSSKGLAVYPLQNSSVCSRFSVLTCHGISRARNRSPANIYLELGFM